jgi:hypothetical protein
MITLKKIMFISTIVIFSIATYNSVNAKDCSNPKGFHQKLSCKFSGESPSKVQDSSKNSGKDTIWKRIKNFGGKNIGEEG